MPVPGWRHGFILLSIVVVCAVTTLAQSYGQIVEEVVEDLRRFNVEQRPITVSGFSSGGTMAMQLQVAFSRNIAGSATFSSIWYRCAPYGSLYYRKICSTGLNSVGNGIGDARRFASTGRVDSLEYLRNQTHYHYIATKDILVYFNPRIRADSRTFFEGVGMDPQNILLVFQDSEHWMPTENMDDTPCSTSLLLNVIVTNRNTSGVAFCDYYGAFEGLHHTYRGNLVRPSGYMKLQPLRAFRQSVFLDPGEQHFMDEVGYFYVPSQCYESPLPCRLHVAMHGCRGSRSAVGTEFITRSGYLAVAEANNIVMLFPQSIRFQGNRNGCWDAFGITNSENYATKDGVQMKALRRMIETATGLNLA